MKFIKAYAIVTVSQLSGYTDMTPVFKKDDNYYRLLHFRAVGFDLRDDGTHGVNHASEALVLKFNYSINQN